jgi:hypothetical protein
MAIWSEGTLFYILDCRICGEKFPLKKKKGGSDKDAVCPRCAVVAT